MINRAIKIILVITFLPEASSAQSFFDERYRGWLWFEQKDKASLEQQDISREFTKLEMEQIKRENEAFKEELELLKHVMIKYPDSIEHVRRYKEKEKQMLTSAMTLTNTFLMTNFLNPDIANHLENPQNMYGREAKKQLEEEANSRKLRQLAHEVELFVFIKDSCKYCAILEKHLARFADRYGFKVEAVSKDGAKSTFFKTNMNAELIEILSLKQMPTVIAVTKDSKMRFELARGAVSVADLEENSLLMVRYLEGIKAQEGR